MPIVIPEMTPQQQAEAVISTESREHERPRKHGDQVFLISATWFASWCEYTGHVYDPQQRKLLGTNNRTQNNEENQDVFSDIAEEKPRPGPIDCSNLLDPTPPAGDLTSQELALATPLRPGLKEKEDFWILHEATWQLLKNWYGCNGPEIFRQYIAVGIQRRLEVHHDQWFLKAIDEHSGRTAVVPTLRMCTVAALKDAVCAALDVEADEVQFAGYPGMAGEPQTLEDKTLKTLVGAQIQNYQAVLVRRKDHPDVAAAAAAAKRMALMQTPNSTVPLASAAIPMSIENNNITNTTATATATTTVPIPNVVTSFTLPSLSPLGSLSPKYKLGTSPANLGSSSPLSRSFSKAPSWADDAIIPSSHRRPGLAGLGNLGNTCFMNSSLQCLVHSMPLMRTFLTGAYRADLNRDNPLGLGGKLAAAFGGLMGKLWQGGVGHVSPKHFKWQLGKFAPQFGGYAQQDSQELLAFLLDGLHEDLNRIAVKPYFEEKDDDDRPDAEVAAEAWDNYRARNDSVIVDHFQGLYKSSLQCPECSRTSVKFDPFMYLSLPLPTPKTRTLTVIIVDAAGAAAPLQVSVEVMKTGTIGDILEKVAACCGSEGDNKISTEEENKNKSNSGQHQWLLAQWSLSGVEKLILFRDLKLPVSSIKEPVKSSFMFSSTKPATLIAYRFPASSPASASASGGGSKSPLLISHGPESGFRPIVVFHKAKYLLSGVPTVLFLPTKATAAAVVISENSDTMDNGDAENMTTATAPAAGEPPQQEKEEDFEELSIERQKTLSTRWALVSPNIIEDALVSFMRPFIKENIDPRILIKGNDKASPATAAAGAVAAVAEPTPMQEGTEPTAADVALAEDVKEDVGMTDVASMSDLLDPLLFPATEEDGTAVGENAVENGGVGVAGTGGENLNDAVVADNTTTTTTGGGVENMAVDGDSQLPSNTLEPPAPLETPEVEAPVAPAAVQKSGGVSLMLAKANGDVRTAVTLAPSLGNASTEDPLYFLIEWSDDVVTEALDLTPWTTPAKHQSAIAAAAAAAAPPRSVTLNDCVDTFLQPEKLDASDSWYCTGCKSHVQAEKKLDLWRLPEVLVVHLKRFSYSRYSRDKLDTEVDFPLQGLDLRNVVPIGEGGTRIMDPTNTKSKTTDNNTLDALENKNIKNRGEGEDEDGPATMDSDYTQPNTTTTTVPPPPAPVYDLYAVSNHYGGLGGGHYTAYCQMPDDKKWYTFDDSSVTEMDPTGVKSPAAYVLFYRRRGAEAQDGDVERVIESAQAHGGDGASGSGGGGASLTDIDLFTGGFGGVSGGGQLTPRRASGQLPALEQVTEGDEENVGTSSAAAVGLTLDDDDEPPPLLLGTGIGTGILGAPYVPYGANLNEDDDGDEGMFGRTTEITQRGGLGAGIRRGILQQQQQQQQQGEHQPSLAAHALPLDDLDDVAMDDI